MLHLKPITLGSKLVATFWFITNVGIILTAIIVVITSISNRFSDKTEVIYKEGAIQTIITKSVYTDYTVFTFKAIILAITFLIITNFITKGFFGVLFKIWNNKSSYDA